MTVKVWHRLNPTFFEGRADELALDAFPDGFEHVANVEGFEPTEPGTLVPVHLGLAFELTNHIDNPWWDNAGVTKVVDGNRRSTSVGDVIELPTGEAHAVAGVGFTKIREATVPAGS